MNAPELIRGVIEYFSVLEPEHPAETRPVSVLFAKGSHFSAASLIRGGKLDVDFSPLREGESLLRLEEVDLDPTLVLGFSPLREG